MVVFDKKTFYETLENPKQVSNISLESINEIISKYPAFDTAYLLQSIALHQKNNSEFETKLPFTAIQIRNRAVLHDLIYTAKSEKYKKTIEVKKLEEEKAAAEIIAKQEAEKQILEIENEARKQAEIEAKKLQEEKEKAELFAKQEEEKRILEIENEAKINAEIQARKLQTEKEQAAIFEKQEEEKQILEIENEAKFRKLSEQAEIDARKLQKGKEQAEIFAKQEEEKRVLELEIEAKIQAEIEARKLQKELKQTEIFKKQEEEKQISETEINSKIDAIDEKELKRQLAMKSLQDELFGAKTISNAEIEIDEKEKRRLEAMQNLQNELFEDKTKQKIEPSSAETKEEVLEIPKIKSGTEVLEKVSETLFNQWANVKPTADKNETTKKQEVSEILKSEEVLEEVKNEKLEKVIASTFTEPEPIIDAVPTIEIVPKIELEEKIVRQDTQKLIADLIRKQEEKVKRFAEEESFKVKEPKLDFIDWLKLKSLNHTEIKKEVFVEEIKIEEEKILEKEEITLEKEDFIPFERVSAVEAEMHQEIKTASDPLESFISSEIIRKRNKRKTEENTSKSAEKAVLVSETLAEILTLQQKYDEAIEVYTLLGLKYPQKSIYFTAQIEKIKNYL